MKMPVSPKNKDDLATLDSNNPSAGELKSKVPNTSLSQEKPKLNTLIETRDDGQNVDNSFENWLENADSEDLSLYYDNSSEDQTEASEPIARSVMESSNQRDEATALPASEIDAAASKEEGEEDRLSEVSEKDQNSNDAVSTENLVADVRNEEEKAGKQPSPTKKVQIEEQMSKTVHDETTEEVGGDDNKDNREEYNSTTAGAPSSTEGESAKEQSALEAIPNKVPQSTSKNEITPPTDLQIETIVGSLKNSKTLNEAEESIKSLDMAMDSRIVTEKASRTRIAETITNLDGNRIIMEALKKWQDESVEIVDAATCLLVALTQVFPEASKAIAMVGLDGILKTAEVQPENYFLIGNILALLLNLSTLDDETTKETISKQSCIDIVFQTTQKWPDKEYIQKCGAGYFARLHKIQAARNGKEQEKASERQVPEATVQAGEPNAQADDKAAKIQSNARSAQEYKAPHSEEEVARMLRRLRDSKNEESAAQAVKVISRSMDSRLMKSVSNRKKVAERIVRLNGVAAIVLALEKWFEKSQTFAYYALTLLVSLSKFAAGSRQAIATIGCKTVLDTAAKYADDYYTRGNILILLQNLGNHKDIATKYEVAEDDCIDCVIDTMKRWPGDAYIQHCGCDYFFRIVSIKGMASKLQAMEIDVLLLGVMDDFSRKGDEQTCNCAKSLLDKIHQNAEYAQ